MSQPCTIPPPEPLAELLEIVLSVPLPVFREADGKPWTRHSYRKAWLAAIEAASTTYPRLRGLWARDLRKAAVTRMCSAGIDPAIAGKVAGHAAAMGDHYMQATEMLMSEAILSL